MKKLLLAAAAVMALGTTAKAELIEGGAWGCSMNIWKSWTQQWHAGGQDTLDCAKATVGAMNWLEGAMTTSTDYFNDIVDHINDVDGGTGTVEPAGGGGVGKNQRDAVIVKYNNLLGTIEDYSTHLTNRYNIIVDLCDTLEDNSVSLSTEQADICNDFY